MGHDGHARVVCSRCGTLVAQCRCLGPKPTELVDGCSECEHVAEPDSTDPRAPDPLKEMAARVPLYPFQVDLLTGANGYLKRRLAEHG